VNRLGGTVKNIDGILIDDDIWIRSFWEQRCQESGRALATFANVQQSIELLASSELDRTIPVFVDSYLGDDEPLGQIQAKAIFDFGYQNIYLSTSAPPDNWQDFSYLKGVINKEPPSWFVCINADPKQARSKLLERMTSEQRVIFDKRMNELISNRQGLDAGAWPVSDGSGSYWPEEVLDAWEEALYHNPSDEALEQIIHDAWFGAVAPHENR